MLDQTGTAAIDALWLADTFGAATSGAAGKAAGVVHASGRMAAAQTAAARADAAAALAKEKSHGPCQPEAVLARAGSVDFDSLCHMS